LIIFPNYRVPPIFLQSKIKDIIKKILRVLIYLTYIYFPIIFYKFVKYSSIIICLIAYQYNYRVDVPKSIDNNLIECFLGLNSCFHIQRIFISYLRFINLFIDLKKYILYNINYLCTFEYLLPHLIKFLWIKIFCLIRILLKYCCYFGIIALFCRG